MKLENEISEVFNAEEIIPSAGQGIIALQCRNDDKNIISNELSDCWIFFERVVFPAPEGDDSTSIKGFFDLFI